MESGPSDSLQRQKGPLATNHVRSSENIDAIESAEDCKRFSVGAVRRTSVPLALGSGGDLIHRNLDAERGRGMADDPADDVSVDGRPGTGSNDPPGFSGDLAGGSACGHGGPAAVLADHSGLDGGGRGIAGRFYIARTYDSV